MSKKKMVMDGQTDGQKDIKITLIFFPYINFSLDEQK